MNETDKKRLYIPATKKKVKSNGVYRPKEQGKRKYR